MVKVIHLSPRLNYHQKPYKVVDLGGNLEATQKRSSNTPFLAGYHSWPLSDDDPKKVSLLCQ